ncbi:DNA-binding protein [Spirillospora sp. NPDC048911]|uniref:DNA-binding protein n=1 Tax=Spirillospora sp. NPDC048911 TaxID=3364527 RepID=UPI00371680D5
MTFPELFQLPTVVDLATAGRAVGVSLNTAYKLVHNEAFPCPVMRLGWRYKVSTIALMKALSIESLPVFDEDVEAGSDFATRIA